MSVRALIVDDEPLARRELGRLVADHPWIEIVGQATHVAEAIAEIGRLAPDLVFLDIAMPGGSGFDVVAALDHAPQVIFTTAFDEYAVRAFEVNALDYLLKPIDPERLARALARVTRSAEATKAEGPGRVFVRDGTRCWFVPLDQVRLIEADGNYSRLLWGREQPMLARSLTALEARLDPQTFFRASRKHIVNLSFVEAIDPDPGGQLVVRLRDGGERVEISRRQARAFRERLSL